MDIIHVHQTLFKDIPLEFVGIWVTCREKRPHATRMLRPWRCRQGLAAKHGPQALGVDSFSIPFKPRSFQKPDRFFRMELEVPPRPDLLGGPQNPFGFGKQENRNPRPAKPKRRIDVR